MIGLVVGACSLHPYVCVCVCGRSCGRVLGRKTVTFGAAPSVKGADADLFLGGGGGCWWWWWGVRGFERSLKDKSAEYVTGSSSLFKNPTLG